MKNLLITTVLIAAASLVGMQALASVSLHIDAADLLDNAGNMAPLNTVGLWIVDTSGGANLSPVFTLGENIAVGATLTGTTDKVIANNDINTSTATTGSLGLDFFGSYGVGVGTGVAAGQKFGIIWLVNQALAQTTAAYGHYGEFTDQLGSDSITGNPWVTPPDGQSVSFDMTTVSESGNLPNSDGLANLPQLIPEPSSIMLVVMGLFGGFGLIRRRR